MLLRNKEIKALSLVCLSASVSLVMFKLADYHQQGSGAFTGCLFMGIIFGIAAFGALIILYMEIFFKDA